MATNIYDQCTNPISGESFKTISFDPVAYIMQWTVQAKGYVPFEHIHLNQDEVFHIKQGELKIVLNGKEQIGKAGDTITVPKGTAHIASNNKDEILNCIVEYRPGLDHDKFMQSLMGLTNDKYLDKKGGIDIPKMGYFLTKMKAKCMARPTEIPAPLFNIALKVFYVRGIISGWGKLFNKYTNE
ncbi:MAG: cupin domain-containing protein [Bacteroidia bacterium]